MNHLFRYACAVFVASVLAQAAAPPVADAEPPRRPVGSAKVSDRVTQIATVEQLSRGSYAGTHSVAQVQRTSDFGIGTFDGLDGELVMLGGVVYQARSTGLVRTATSEERIPFATLTRFRSEHRFESMAPLADYPALQAFLSTAMTDQNAILAIRLHGSFATLKLRAPQRQDRPYPALADALKTQGVFELTQIAGTFVGFRFPAYVGSLNSAGYHFHFLSDDRKSGGHVLEAASSAFTADIETVEQYEVTLAAAD
jgi:acetolactate decarboxylase